MKLTITSTCYTHLMWMLTFRAREFSDAVYKYECSSPNFSHEGLNGYIECVMSFEIKDLPLFAKIYTDWYTATGRSEFYGQIVNLNRCQGSL